MLSNKLWCRLFVMRTWAHLCLGQTAHLWTYPAALGSWLHYKMRIHFPCHNNDNPTFVCVNVGYWVGVVRHTLLSNEYYAPNNTRRPLWNESCWVHFFSPLISSNNNQSESFLEWVLLYLPQTNVNNKRSAAALWFKFSKSLNDLVVNQTSWKQNKTKHLINTLFPLL